MAEQDEPEILPALPTVPLDGVNITADDGLPTVVVEDDPAPPLGRSWAFDFRAESFVRLGSHGPRETHGAETLLLWIDKCLHSQRGALDIHPPDYGLEDPYSIFGKPVAQLSTGDLEEKFRAALTLHPRIADIADVELKVDPDTEQAYVQFTVLTDPPTEDAALATLRLSLES